MLMHGRQQLNLDVLFVYDDHQNGFIDNTNGDVSNTDSYGLLYNYYVVSDDKVCPLGWHIPSLTDWNTLISYTGGITASAFQLKSENVSGAIYWESSNMESDPYGFSARGNSLRYADGSYPLITDPDRVKAIGTFWIKDDNGSPRYVRFSDISNNAIIFNGANNLGLGIRCVKD